MKLSIIQSDPDILGGTPVFRGTRVPIQTLFDHLPEPGIEEFLAGFPSVTREMVEALLQEAAKRLTRKTKKMNYESYA